MYPNHTIISRSGEIDAWDNPEFRAAVEATGRTQMIMAGISTDVCKYSHEMFMIKPVQMLTQS
jgi:nicotinamidase-related amidase